MTNDPGDRSRLRAYLELLRLPNLFTAMADMAMGLLFVRADEGPRADLVMGLLVAASALLYATGVVLNDVFDLERDRAERPDRPLPSGRISLAAARRLGWGLLVAGAAAACLAAVAVGQFRPALIVGLLSGCIVLYDGWLKATWLGPPVMGACRMLNVLLGMSVADERLAAEHFLVAGGIGIYVMGVTWLARTEARRSSRGQLALAAFVMLLGVATLGWFPSWTNNVVELVRLEPQRWYLLVGALGVLIGWRCLRAVIEPTPRMVQTAVVYGILSLVMLDAVACFAVRGLAIAAILLLLLVPAMFLGRWISPT
jgi:4-hydroxybenzoate polyprenyltransferase